jgi:CDP-glucose 4,6-dehydratase
MSVGGSWESVNVLVTGGCGFVGSWLARALVESGANVTCLSRGDWQGSPLDLLGLGERVRVVGGSTTDYTLVARILDEFAIEVCFHLAAQPLVGVAGQAPLTTFETNIQGTWNVLEACRSSARVRRVIVASSDRAYEGHQDVPGLHPYDASKACADILVRCYFQTYGIAVAATRFVNIYGGGDTHCSRLVPETILAVLRGEPPVIRSDGSPERDFLYIDDAVRGYMRVAECLEWGATGQVFDFRANAPISILKLVERIIALSDHPELRPRVLGTATPPAAVSVRGALGDRARDVLGWAPAVGLDEGLTRTYRWYREHLGRLGGRRP